MQTSEFRSFLFDRVRFYQPKRLLFQYARVQLSCVLAVQILSVLAVFCFLKFFGKIEIEALTQHTTILPFIYCFTVNIIAWFSLRKLHVYPGKNKSILIMPVFVMAYLGMIFLLFIFRLDYSRFVISSSFLGSVIWLQIADGIWQRRRSLKLSIIPGGNLYNVEDVKGTTWEILNAPRLVGTRIDGVVADLRHDHSIEWEYFIADCVLAGIPVYNAKHILESFTGKVELEHLSENTFGSVLPSNAYLLLKRIVDVIGAILVLPFFGIVILFVAIFIKLESAGPIFFIQQRMGYRATLFKMFKMRSMKLDNNASNDFTKEDDPRITKVGKFIRKYRIDELPQVINILKGEMSWIGPRPESRALVQVYEENIPFYVYRNAVLPGITGWAQVNQGNVGGVDDAKAKLHYDFYYIKNVSPALDFLIALKTVYALISGFGSR